MKILGVIPQFGAGGAEAVALALTEDACRRGDDALVASAGGFRVRDLHRVGARHETLRLVGRRPADLASSVRTLRRLVRGWEPDVVHAHNVKAAAVTRAAAGNRVPLLVTVHGVPDREYAAAARVLRHAATRVVAVSDDVAARLVAEGLPPDRVDVVENAVVPPRTHDRLVARAALNLPDGAPVVSCIARLVPQKRHDLLLEAWAQLGSDGFLLMAGGGPTRPRLEDRARRLGLGDRVRFLGERDDVDRILAATDVSVLPTDWEGLPISILEAMATGVPVVASAVGALPGVLGDAAVLVPPGDARALATALHAVLADGPARRRLAGRGRALVADRFGQDRMGRDYRDRYDALVGGSPRRELVP